MMTTGTPVMWTLFAAFVLLALLVDFFAMERQGAHKVTMKEAAIWSLVWIVASFLFVGWLWWYLGGLDGNQVAGTKALEFITGYLVEKALAVDNIFVFLTVFTYFAVPVEYQKRVLMIGILAAHVLRAMYFLLAGMHQRFHLLSYGLAIVLVFIGATMLLSLRIPPQGKAQSAYPFAVKAETEAESGR